MPHVCFPFNCMEADGRAWHLQNICIKFNWSENQRNFIWISENEESDSCTKRASSPMGAGVDLRIISMVQVMMSWSAPWKPVSAIQSHSIKNVNIMNCKFSFGLRRRNGVIQMNCDFDLWLWNSATNAGNAFSVIDLSHSWHIALEPSACETC